MKTYLVQYKIEAGDWYPAIELRARSNAGAIAQMAASLTDIEAQSVTIVATEK